jgi:sulfatase maturation enzyme AslB (radical SAM superfamily)
MAGLLEISTVVGCKMMCSYCPQHTHINTYAATSRNFRISIEDFQSYISTVPTEVDIVFAGMAEPFLNKSASAMIVAAVSKGHRVSIYTTCEGMDDGDLTMLRVFIQKWPERFNHICLHLPDADGKMKIKITDEYLRMVKSMMSLQNNLMCIGKLHPQVREAIGVDVTDGSLGLYSRGGNIPSMAITKKIGKLHCSVCTDKLDHNILLPNGDVVLCCMDYDQDHVIGNLGTMTYEQLFQSAEYNKVIEGLKDDNSEILCRYCEVSKHI